ncbi:MAG: ATP-dependent RecD-like DNA helicase [Tenericutes bacterium HGW-Tenericutes-4]|nr:MAG: ATP-dependent RecD-like DNA helicase [Tenericutes bacterium HGW-Tenericutes-4]
MVALLPLFIYNVVILKKGKIVVILKGSIEDVIYRNEENGYTVVSVNCSNELITAVGKFSSANHGEVVELSGNFVNNTKFGEQFRAESVKVLPPNTLDGIERYLSSGLIKGIGPVTANLIVQKFKESTLEVIEFNPMELKKIKGISENKAVQIATAFSEIKKMQNAVMFLQNHEITTNLAVKIYKHYLDRTEEILQTNPYRLVEDVDGIGFLTADKIAQKLGIEPYSAFRFRAAVLHLLKENADKNGNTYLPVDDLELELTKLLNLNLVEHTKTIEDVVKSLIFENAIYHFEIDNKKVLMQTKFYLMEREIAEKLVLLKQNGEDKNFNLTTEIAEYERKNKVKLHVTQKEAVEMAVSSGVSVITGGPGTGKTTIIKCLINSFTMQGKEVLLLAPTGRASKRLNESTNHEASTIHRALGVDFQSDSGIFTYNEQNKLPADVIIVDEVSMVDVPLMYSMLKAIKKTANLVLVGDKNQLPSVGAGNVLADILTSGIIKKMELTKIYRQDAKSLIITNAHAINNGYMPELDNSSSDFFFENKADANEMLRTVVDLVVTRIPKFLNIDPFKIQVLAAIRLGACGVTNLNKELQSFLNPNTINKPEIVTENIIYRVGDKVMQTTNNYNQEWVKVNKGYTEQGKGVFNGDIGFIEAINNETKEVIVQFEDGRRANYLRSDLMELSLSYATTIHKSQGSEFDVVIIPILGGAPTMMTRNLLYTAVTRAKKMVILVGTKFNIKRMIDNTYTKTRYSKLKFDLIEAQKNIDFLYGA